MITGESPDDDVMDGFWSKTPEQKPKTLWGWQHHAAGLYELMNFIKKMQHG